MAGRPYVVCSAAMSLDGHLDDTSAQRLVLSGPADLDRVDEERACCDAILVGAQTVRRDNPRLLVRSPQRRQRRIAAGLPEQPVKVTLTATGELDPTSEFFTAGDATRLVYATSRAMPALAGVAAIVVDAGERLQLPWLLEDLTARGVGRLLVEGGSAVLRAFLTGGLADELQLALAPVFVGEAAAPRFVAGPDTGHRLQLVEARVLDDVVVLRYRLGAGVAP